jgi:N-acetylglutamate synthase-like GNAT family acetyltransferase
VTIEIAWYDGPHADLLPLFRLAEDSAEQLAAYLDAGRVLVARENGKLVGHLQLVPTEAANEAEIKNMAVVDARQGSGVGRALVEAAVAACEADDVRRVLVSTAAASSGNLRFYQRVGFRMLSVERDAFVPATGYPEQIMIEGIPLRDRVWLSRDLAPFDAG